MPENQNNYNPNIGGGIEIPNPNDNYVMYPIEYNQIIDAFNRVYKAYLGMNYDLRTLDADNIYKFLVNGIKSFYKSSNASLEKIPNPVNSDLINRNKKVEEFIVKAINDLHANGTCITFDDYNTMVPYVACDNIIDEQNKAKPMLEEKINEFIAARNPGLLTEKMANDTMVVQEPVAEQPTDTVKEEQQMDEPKSLTLENNPKRGSSDLVLIIATIGITLVVLVAITLAIFAFAK
ncbi:MAG: hypothetical protein IJ574_04690 [Bacilli bacterium]|nr:hypothetical protein [Bacilli bacterium]